MINKGDKILRHLYQEPSYFENTKLDVIKVLPEINSVETYFMGKMIISIDNIKKVL